MRSFFINLLSDLKVQSGNSFFNKIKVLVFSHSFHLVFFVRFSSEIRKVKFLGSFLSTFLDYLIRVIFSSDISSRAVFGKGVNIMHGHDIVIGSHVVIGENVKIFNGVTLGNKNTNTIIVEQPLIGNNVTICTGAKVLGSVRIGDNSVIGANSVVLKDVPKNEVWAGIPAKKIKDIDFV